MKAVPDRLYIGRGGCARAIPHDLHRPPPLRGPHRRRTDLEQRPEDVDCPQLTIARPGQQAQAPRGLVVGQAVGHKAAHHGVDEVRRHALGKIPKPGRKVHRDAVCAFKQRRLGGRRHRRVKIALHHRDPLNQRARRMVLNRRRHVAEDPRHVRRLQEDPLLRPVPGPAGPAIHDCHGQDPAHHRQTQRRCHDGRQGMRDGSDAGEGEAGAPVERGQRHHQRSKTAGRHQGRLPADACCAAARRMRLQIFAERD